MQPSAICTARAVMCRRAPSAGTFRPRTDPGVAAARRRRQPARRRVRPFWRHVVAHRVPSWPVPLRSRQEHGSGGRATAPAAFGRPMGTTRRRGSAALAFSTDAHPGRTPHVTTIRAVAHALRPVAAAALAAAAVTGALVAGAVGQGTASAATSATVIEASSLEAHPTVWLCRPGAAHDPCLTSQTTTVVGADGSTKVVTPSRLPSRRWTASTCTDRERPAHHQRQLRHRPRGDSHRRRPGVALLVGLPGVGSRLPPAHAVGNRWHRSERPGVSTAYEGVQSAWLDYLAHDNHGRPVVFIGHSQGAAMLIQLLKAQVDPVPSVRKKLVSAIILGGNVTVPVGKTVGVTSPHPRVPVRRPDRLCDRLLELLDATAGRLALRSGGTGRERAFGPAAGQRPPGALCEPRALGGGSGTLEPYFPTAAFPGPLGANDPGLPYATPWVSDPDLITGRSASTAAAPAGCRWTAKPALATTARSCPRAWGPPGAAPRGREPRAWQPGRHRAQRGRRLPRLRPGHVRRARRPFEVRPAGASRTDRRRGEPPAPGGSRGCGVRSRRLSRPCRSATPWRARPRPGAPPRPSCDRGWPPTAEGEGVVLAPGSRGGHLEAVVLEHRDHHADLVQLAVGEDVAVHEGLWILDGARSPAATAMRRDAARTRPVGVAGKGCPGWRWRGSRAGPRPAGCRGPRHIPPCGRGPRARTCRCC